MPTRFIGTLEEYMLGRRLEDPETGCWYWAPKGVLVAKGYGYFCWEGVWMYAHRASFQLWKGKIPKGLSVLHNCDKPLCFNPDHLFVGTQKENLEDMTRKGRRTTHTDEARAKRKASIRKAWEEGRQFIRCERDLQTGRWKSNAG